MLYHKFNKCDASRDLAPFLQFKKHETHPWRSVTFSKVTGFSLKVTFLHGCFSRFLDCTNGTKSRNTSQIHSTKFLQIIKVWIVNSHFEKRLLLTKTTWIYLIYWPKHQVSQCISLKREFWHDTWYIVTDNSS